MRAQSQERFERLRRQYAARAQLIPLIGDLTEPLLGLSEEQLQQLTGKIDHCFHLAATYDMTASEAESCAQMSLVHAPLCSWRTASRWELFTTCRR